MFRSRVFMISNFVSVSIRVSEADDHFLNAWAARLHAAYVILMPGDGRALIEITSWLGRF